MTHDYKIINRKNPHNGFYKLSELTFKHKKHNGTWSNSIKREISSGNNAVTVLPFDPKEEKIIWIKQFRLGVKKMNINPIFSKIVSGMIDQNESPENTAIREYKEETGCIIKKLKKICSYFPEVGTFESYFHLFLGEVQSFRSERIAGKSNENEDILAESYPVNTVRELLRKISFMWCYSNSSPVVFLRIL